MAARSNQNADIVIVGEGKAEGRIFGTVRAHHGAASALESMGLGARIARANLLD